MGLKIALGIKSVSSRPIAPPEPREEFAQDGAVLKPSEVCFDDSSNSKRKNDELDDGQECSLIDAVSPGKGNLFFSAISADHQIQALVTLSYYDMVRDNPERTRDYTMAELRIQISPADKPISSAYRDIPHRIELPESSSLEDEIQSNDSYAGENSAFRIYPCAIFSTDKRFLTCLIPYPDGNKSAVVVFQLRRPTSQTTINKKQQQRRPPPTMTPSYIRSTATSTSAVNDVVVIPVATNPKVFKFNADGVSNLEEKSSPVLPISSICDVAMKGCGNKSSLLLAGYQNGSILAISYHPLRIVDLLYSPSPLFRFDEDNQGTTMPALPPASAGIRYMEHFSELSCDALNSKRCAGKLVTVGVDGSVTIFQSELVLNNNKKEARMRIDPTWDCGGSKDTAFVCAKWMSSSYLALLSCPGPVVQVQVWGLHPSKQQARPVVTTEMTRDRLEENAHTHFFMDPLPLSTDTNDEETSGNGSSRIKDLQGCIGLEYDAASNCLAISSVLVKEVGRYTNSLVSLCTEQPCYPFVFLWNWRNNVASFTAAPSSPFHSDLAASLLSRLVFARGSRGASKIGHLIGSINVDATICKRSQQQCRIRKELFETGILSPPSDTCLNGNRTTRRASSLLMSSYSVAYPVVGRACSHRNEYEIEWQESRIPSAYLSFRGSPIIASIGQSLGRSVAVAASRGICTMELHPGKNRGKTTKLNASPGHPTAESAASVMKQSNAKWHLFGNETEEGSFSVAAMMWWEGCSTSNSNSEQFDEMSSDDILVAVIDVYDREKSSAKSRYLSCWSQNRLDFNHQLLKSKGQDDKSSRWGIRLPNKTRDVCIDLLEQPKQAVPQASQMSARKAVVLVTYGSSSTQYSVYQIQLSHNSSTENTGAAAARSYPEEMPYYALGKCSSTGEIGSPSELFLASASFGFDLKHDGGSSAIQEDSSTSLSLESVYKDDNSNCHDGYIATLGAIRTAGQGVDALAVSSTSVIAVGQVIRTEDNDAADLVCNDLRSSEISRYWMVDIVRDKKVATAATDGIHLDLFVWGFQLANGRLFSWSVPFVNCPEGSKYMSEPLLELEEGATSIDLKDSTKGASIRSSLHLVHPKGVLLGFLCPIGSASTWMMQSTAVTSAWKEHTLGCVPESFFGCVLSTGQSCRKVQFKYTCENFEQDLFRQDFLQHDILCPSDFNLSPPAFIISLYALVADVVASRAQTMLGFEESQHYIRAHVERKLNESNYRDSAIMALQLLILRLVEKVAATTKTDEQEGLTSAGRPSTPFIMLAALVDSIRLILTPLQLATLFLEVGRRMEPSCFPFLFPLPASSGQGTVVGCETIEDIFHIATKYGSIKNAVSALPLLGSTEMTRSSCVMLFRHCFNTMVRSGFDPDRDEAAAIGDVFRYSIQINGFGEEQTFDRSTLADDDLISLSTDDSVVGFDNNIYENKNEYSIMCGLKRLLGGKSRLTKEEQAIVDAASSFIGNGFDPLLIEQAKDFSKSEEDSIDSVVIKEIDGGNSVIGVAAHGVLASVFDAETTASRSCWEETSVIATLLVGEGWTNFRSSSPSVFMELMRKTNVSSFHEFLPQQGRIGLVNFFKKSITACKENTDATKAGRILDLISILIAPQESPDLLKIEIPGLLLIAIVAGHVANRTAEIANDDASGLLIWSSYLEAKVWFS